MNAKAHRSPSGSIFAAMLVLIGIPCGPASSAAEPPITAIAFSADGKSVVAASQSGVTEYEWPSLERTRAVQSSSPNPHDLAFSPNGRFLAIAGGSPTEEGTVEVLAWPDGSLAQRLDGHDDSVMSVDWIDDTTLASAAMDRQLIIWKRTSGDVMQRLRGHSKGVTSICLIPASGLLVSAGIDQNLRVWDLKSATLVRSLNNHTSPVNDLALRPGNHSLPIVVSASEDRTVRLWQPSIGRMVRFVRLGSIPLQVEWLADGSAIVVACLDGVVRVIDPDTIEVLHELPAVDGWAYAMAVHPSNQSLVVGGTNGQLKRVSLPSEPRSR